MKYTFSIILVGLSLISFNACSSSQSSSNQPSSTTWTQAVQKLYTGYSSASLSDLDRLSIPILKSDSLSKKWGAPKVEKSTTGYTISYADPKQPFRRLVIYGMKQSLPTLSSPPKYSGEDMVNGELTGYSRAQSWRPSVNIAGTPVRWFMESAGGGADGAYYSTEGFGITANGKTGYYRIVIESGEGANVEKEIASWLKSITL